MLQELTTSGKQVIRRVFFESFVIKMHALFAAVCTYTVRGCGRLGIELMVMDIAARRRANWSSSEGSLPVPDLAAPRGSTLLQACGNGHLHI